MTTKIVTDSTSDLPQSVIDRYGIVVINNYINMQGKSYLDGIDISRQEFYERLPGCNPSPTTSGPGIDTYIRTYRRLAEEGANEVISIHVASELSNITNIAILAARETPELPVTVIDSKQLSLGLGYQVIAAAQAAAAGCSVKEIKELIDRMIPRVYIFAVLDTLEYLARSGRVSRFMSGLGNLLQIKPVATVYKGLANIDRERTLRNATRRMIELAERIAPLEHLSMVHANAPDRLENVKRMIQHLFPAGKESFSEEVTPIIGVHVGPGTVAMICVTAG